MAKVTMEKERVATPPQPSAVGQTSRGRADMEVVQVEALARIEVDLTGAEEEDVSQIKVYRLTEAMLNKALHSGHNKFWSEMGLHHFLALEWSSHVGTLEECRQFVMNSSSNCTRTSRYEIDLSEKSLAKIFGLPSSDRNAPLRSGKWQSKKFNGTKDKNGYKLAQCTDLALVERLEFLRQALYIQLAKTTVPVSLVREAEEVMGKGVNWAKHFHKQFHHELAQVRGTKCTMLGSHLQIIFGWIKNSGGGGVATLIKEKIPASITLPQEAAVPSPPVNKVVVTPVVAEVPEVPLTLSQEEQNVAQIVSSLNRTATPDLNENAPKASVVAPAGKLSEDPFVVVIPHRVGRPVFNRVESTASENTAGEPPSNGVDGDSGAAPMEDDEDDRPRTPSNRFHDIDGATPRYIQEAILAEQRGDMYGMVVELGKLNKRAFCEDLAAGHLEIFKEYTDSLFWYLPWMAKKVKELKEENDGLKVEIVDLKTRIEDMANFDNYDHLLKEKSSWSSAKKQLEDDLLEATNTTKQAIQERDVARETAATHATKIEKETQTLERFDKELTTLRNSDDQFRNDNHFLTSEVERLRAELKDKDTQLDKAVGERDEALQDAENADNMKEGLLKRIANLEAKFLTPKGPQDIGKRQRVA
ncbi:unnamed protein product [Calypogeia fissa]